MRVDQKKKFIKKYVQIWCPNQNILIKLPKRFKSFYIKYKKKLSSTIYKRVEDLVFST